MIKEALMERAIELSDEDVERVSGGAGDFPEIKLDLSDKEVYLLSGGDGVNGHACPYGDKLAEPCSTCDCRGSECSP